ncbi:MAG: sugar phosphate isomerase/epimerase [Spirochaetes bacterium]|nr:sugar phosphate isomerase/epimerase [Spirochaetota bacterium]
MKLAFSTLGCPEFSIIQAIEAAKQYGYEGISLRTVRGQSYLPELEEFSPKQISCTAKLIQQAGITVPCVMTGVHFTSPDPSERERQLKTAESYIEIAYALRAPTIRLFGGPIPPDQEEKKTREWIAEGFRKVGDFAARRGILVLLETHDSFSTGLKARELLEFVSHPNMAIVWDFLHSIRFGEAIERTWEQIGVWVQDVHVKDSSQYSTDGFDLKLPGKGTLPIPEVIRLLHRNSYEGWLTFEWEKGWRPELEEPEVALPRYIEYMKRILSEIGIQTGNKPPASST